MNKKQRIGLVVAALVFVFVASASILTNRIANRIPQAEKSSFMESLLKQSDQFLFPAEDFIGIVEVQGAIVNTPATVFDTLTYNHSKTLELVDALKNSSNNTGLFLKINSPGGGIYESDDLYLKLIEYKEETGRPIWTYMENQAASGGYYIAMPSDNIVANRNTTTGSIGVYIALSNFKELADKIGYEEIYITSGDNKAMGAPTMDITDEQIKMYQSIVDEYYEQFVEIVAEGRDLDEATVKTIADGRIYTSKQALDLNLIDSIDSYDNTIAAFQKTTNNSIVYQPDHNPWGLSSFLGQLVDIKPKSDTQIISEFIETKGSGVPMYYAKPGLY